MCEGLTLPCWPPGCCVSAASRNGIQLHGRPHVAQEPGPL